MTWLTPMVGGVAAAIALPALLILYFLKLKRRQLEVSSTLLWKKAVQDLQANAPFQRLRRNLLLFLQLLVLGAALFAVAQPQWKSGAAEPGKSVILIDRSASMSTRDEMSFGTRMTRLEKAKLDAKRFVDELPSAGFFEDARVAEAMVIAFDSSADVVQTFTGNKGLLRRAIDSIQPTDAPTSIDQAMRLATAYVGPKVVENVGMVAGAPLYLWSDGAIPDIGSLRLHPDTRLEYRALGHAQTVNTAITALRAERPYDRPHELNVFVAVQRSPASDGASSADIELSIEGAVAAAKAVRLATPTRPSQPAQGGVVFRVERPQGAVITARLVEPDALEADNSARIVVPPAKRLKVALVTTGNLFLEAALGGLALGQADILTPAQFADLLKLARTSEYDVFVCDRVNPSNPLGAPTPPVDAPPPGRFLVFGAVPPYRAVTLGETRGEAQPDVPAEWQRDHPALSLLSLDALVVARPMPLKAGAGARILARGTAGPMIVEASQDASRAIIVAFDLMDSNWPFDVGFVLFLASAVGYLGEADASVAQQLAVGTTLTSELPDTVREATITDPSGVSTHLVAGHDHSVTFGPLRTTGLYRLRWSGPPGPRDAQEGAVSVRTFAVNLFDPDESAVATRDSLNLPAQSVSRSDGGDGTGVRRLWPWLLIAAVAFIMLEWLVYNRKTYI